MCEDAGVNPFYPASSTYPFLVDLGNSCQPLSHEDCHLCYDPAFSPDSLVYIDCPQGQDLESEVMCDDYHQCCEIENGGSFVATRRSLHVSGKYVLATVAPATRKGSCDTFLRMDVADEALVVDALRRNPSALRFNSRLAAIEVVNCAGQVIARRRPPPRVVATLAAAQT
jgi:hypothetical protein